MKSGVGLSRLRHKRRSVLAAMLLATTAGIISAGAAVAQGPAQDVTGEYHVPAKPLGEALADFGQQSSLQVSVDASQVAGLRSPGASGRMSAAQALDRLLAGSSPAPAWSGG